MIVARYGADGKCSGGAGDGALCWPKEGAAEAFSITSSSIDRQIDSKFKK